MGFKGDLKFLSKNLFKFQTNLDTFPSFHHFSSNCWIWLVLSLDKITNANVNELTYIRRFDGNLDKREQIQNMKIEEISGFVIQHRDPLLFSLVNAKAEH